MGGTLISINTNKIEEANSAAKKLAEDMKETADSLRKKGSKLWDTTSLADIFFKEGIDKAIYASRIFKQQDRMDNIAQLMQRAADLAAGTSGKLIKESDLIVLAIAALKGNVNIISPVTNLSVIIGSLTALAGADLSSGDLTSLGPWVPLTLKEYSPSQSEIDEFNWKDRDKHGKDYSNYYCIKGFDTDFILNQRKTKYYPAVACTACCDVMVGSIVSGKRKEPQSADFHHGQYAGCATYRNTKVLNGSKVSSKQLKTAADKEKAIAKQCSMAADQIINKGNPVVMRVNGHSVLVVGISKDIDLKNLKRPIKPEDFLIVDPGDGRIKNADQVYSGWASGTGHLTMDPTWSLRIPK